MVFCMRSLGIAGRFDCFGRQDAMTSSSNQFFDMYVKVLFSKIENGLINHSVDYE